MPRVLGHGGRNFVITEAHNVDAGDVGAPTDVQTGMLCPGDGAKVIDVTYTVRTAGTVTTSGTHTLLLEHGLAGAGAALTASTAALDATAAAGTIVTALGLTPSAQPATVKGTPIQIRNTEGGTVTNGAFYDVQVLWQL